MKNKKPKFEITWEAYEFPIHKRSSSWYVGFGIVAALLIIYGIFWGGIIPTITFILAIIVGYFYAHREPRKLKYIVNDEGIVAGDIIFPYQNIRAFWILYHPPEIKTLNFETTAYLNKYISIELNDQNPIQLREYLLNHLVEDVDQEETLGDVITRKAKF